MLKRRDAAKGEERGGFKGAREAKLELELKKKRVLVSTADCSLLCAET